MTEFHAYLIIIVYPAPKKRREFFSKNTSKLKETYLTLVPYLTAKYYENRYPDYFYENSFFHANSVFNQKNFSDEILTQILEDYIEFGLKKDVNDYKYDDDLINIFKKLVIFKNNQGLFERSKECLDNLMGEAIIRKDLLIDLSRNDTSNTDDLLTIDFDFNSTESIDELVNLLDEFVVFDKFNIDKEDFKKKLKEDFNLLDINNIKKFMQE